MENNIFNNNSQLSNYDDSQINYKFIPMNNTLNQNKLRKPKSYSTKRGGYRQNESDSKDLMLEGSVRNH